MLFLFQICAICFLILHMKISLTWVYFSLLNLTSLLTFNQVSQVTVNLCALFGMNNWWHLLTLFIFDCKENDLWQRRMLWQIWKFAWTSKAVISESHLYFRKYNQSTRDLRLWFYFRDLIKLSSRFFLLLENRSEALQRTSFCPVSVDRQFNLIIGLIFELFCECSLSTGSSLSTVRP